MKLEHSLFPPGVDHRFHLAAPSVSGVKTSMDLRAMDKPGNQTWSHANPRGPSKSL